MILRFDMGIRLSLMVLLIAASGCRTVKPSTKISSGGNTADRPAIFDDLRWLGETAGAELLGQRFLKTTRTPPVVFTLEVQNRTTTPFNTRSVTDAFRNVLAGSGRARFIADTDRDALLQSTKQTPATMDIDARLAAGKQLGAKYVCTGWLTETREVHTPPRIDRHYQLVLELTNVSTGLVEWSTKKERRIAARP